MPGILDLLGGINQPQSPESVTIQEDIAKALLNNKNNVLQPVGPDAYKATHWSQGVADMLNAISGRGFLNRSDNVRAGQRYNQPQVTGPPQANVPPVAPPPIAPNTNQPPLNPAQTMFGVRPGPLPETFSNAPTDQGANTNNAPRPARLGGPTVFRSASGQDLTQITAPSGAQFTVHPNYSDRFTGLLNDLHEAGYSVDANQSGGYANRTQRGSNRPSMHASGEAIDVNWGRNREGTQGDIPADLARSLAKKHGLVWLGDRRGPRGPDPMHFEVDRNFRPETNAVVPLADRNLITQSRPREETTPPVVQVADRAPQETPPPPNNVNNRPLGPGGNPVFNPEADFRPTFPTPAPYNYGLTPQQMQGLDFQTPEARKQITDQLSRQWEPQYTDMQGGRRWVVPATGQSGFIPTPKYDHIDTPAGKIPTVSITDQYGRVKVYDLMPQQSAPNANSPVPASQQPPPTAPVAPVETPDASIPPPQVPPLPNQQTPPVQAPNAPVPPAPNAPAATTTKQGDYRPLRHPILEDARQIQIEQSERKTEADKLALSRVEPIESAIQRGDAAVQTREVVRMLAELENTPNIDRVLTGPWGPAMLSFQQTVNGAAQAAGMRPIFDERTVSAGEALNKLNTFLGSVGARQLTNRPTQFDFQAFLKANPGLMTSPHGRRFLTQILTQMAERDAALGDAASRATPQTWPAIRNQILDQHRTIIDGTLLDNTMNSTRFDLNTGRLQINTPRRGQIMDGMQYIGRSGSREDGRNPAMWVTVDPRDPRTWRIQEMESVK
jgi:hypothetical protein